MVIDNLYIFRRSVYPTKADPELVIDAHASLTHPVAGELFQPVGGRSSQIFKVPCEVKLFELAQGWAFDIDESSDPSEPEQGLSVFILERPDHHLMITCLGSIVTRYYSPIAAHSAGFGKGQSGSRPPFRWNLGHKLYRVCNTGGEHGQRLKVSCHAPLPAETVSQTTYSCNGGDLPDSRRSFGARRLSALAEKYSPHQTQ